jgi:hypothetical protein
MIRAFAALLCAAMLVAACEHDRVRKLSEATPAMPPPDAGMDAGTAEMVDAGLMQSGLSRSVPATEPVAAAPSAPEPARPVPVISHTESGSTLLELPPTAQPIVTIALQFRSGSIDDPQGKAGITNLTAHLMAEGGTQSLDARQLLTRSSRSPPSSTSASTRS